MEKKYVRLKDVSSTFHDMTSDTTFVGAVPKLVNLTERIRAGIKGGALEEVSKEEATRLIAEADKKAKVSAKGKKKEDAETNDEEVNDGAGAGNEEENNEEEETEKPDYSKMTKPDLQKACKKAKIKFEEGDTRADLIKLLTGE